MELLRCGMGKSSVLERLVSDFFVDLLRAHQGRCRPVRHYGGKFAMLLAFEPESEI